MMTGNGGNPPVPGAAPGARPLKTPGAAGGVVGAALGAGVPTGGAVGAAGGSPQAVPAPAARAAIVPSNPFRMARSCSASRGGTRPPPAEHSPCPERGSQRVSPDTPLPTRTIHVVLLHETIGTIRHEP